MTGSEGVRAEYMSCDKDHQVQFLATVVAS